MAWVHYLRYMIKSFLCNETREQLSEPCVLQGMTAALLLHKPANPCKFLAEYLTGLQKQGAQPALTREELRVMFGMFDVTEKGVVSVAQANQVNNLGIRPCLCCTFVTCCPETGAEDNGWSRC